MHTGGPGTATSSARWALAARPTLPGLSPHPREALARPPCTAWWGEVGRGPVRPSGESLAGVGPLGHPERLLPGAHHLGTHHLRQGGSQLGHAGCRQIPTWCLVPLSSFTGPGMCPASGESGQGAPTILPLGCLGRAWGLTRKRSRLLREELSWWGGGAGGVPEMPWGCRGLLCSAGCQVTQCLIFLFPCPDRAGGPSPGAGSLLPALHPRQRHAQLAPTGRSLPF